MAPSPMEWRGELCAVSICLNFPHSPSPFPHPCSSPGGRGDPGIKTDSEKFAEVRTRGTDAPLMRPVIREED